MSHRRTTATVVSRVNSNAKKIRRSYPSLAAARDAAAQAEGYSDYRAVVFSARESATGEMPEREAMAHFERVFDALSTIGAGEPSVRTVAKAYHGLDTLFEAANAIDLEGALVGLVFSRAPDVHRPFADYLRYKLAGFTQFEGVGCAFAVRLSCGTQGDRPLIAKLVDVSRLVEAFQTVVDDYGLPGGRVAMHPFCPQVPSQNEGMAQHLRVVWHAYHHCQANPVSAQVGLQKVRAPTDRNSIDRTPGDPALDYLAVGWIQANDESDVDELDFVIEELNSALVKGIPGLHELSISSSESIVLLPENVLPAERLLEWTYRREIEQIIASGEDVRHLCIHGRDVMADRGRSHVELSFGESRTRLGSFRYPAYLMAALRYQLPEAEYRFEE